MEAYHKPVLLKKAVEALNVETGSWYVDATLGDGGHLLEIIKLGGKVLGIDVDLEAVKRAELRFEVAGISKDRYRLVQGNFKDLKKILANTGISQIRGVLFDLGVSSLQLEDPARGFSFLKPGPLDMRMDKNLPVRAQDLVNGLNKGELYELFTKLGEERLAQRIADSIVSSRQVKPITTTTELAQIVSGVYKSARIKTGGKHPATKVFQALRIAINDELNSLREALPRAYDILEGGGRVAVISFHSLEDRIVKEVFRSWQNQGKGTIITKKPVNPSQEEIWDNVRARSSKLRIFLK